MKVRVALQLVRKEFVMRDQYFEYVLALCLFGGGDSTSVVIEC